MKNCKQLIAGIVIGSALTGSLAFANNVRTFLAEEANFPVMVNGSPVTLDMPVVTIQDRTYLPLRAMGNVLGIKVDWNEEKAQAEVVTDATPAPTSTVTPTPESTPTPTDVVTPPPTSTTRLAETPDGLEIYYFGGDVGYVRGSEVVDHMIKLGLPQYRYSVDKIVDIENGYETVIANIPRNEEHPTYIPADFYIDTILPFINSKIQ